MRPLRETPSGWLGFKETPKKCSFGHKTTEKWKEKRGGEKTFFFETYEWQKIARAGSAKDNGRQPGVNVMKLFSFGTEDEAQ